MHTPTQGGRFATTRWSVVVAAGQKAGGDDEDARRAALETLCRAYWYPLYVYARRKGHAAEDAADLVQGFFASLLERRAVARADRERGRFRSFLLASLDHYMANEWRRATAQKRGGGAVLVGLDFDDGERRYGLEPSHHLTPDRVYERRWALTLIDAAMGRLRAEYEARDRGDLFAALAGLISGERDEAFAQVAGRLGMSEGAVKVAVHRLRKRCRELLREEVAQTVAGEAEVDDELRHLLDAV
jgi:RNA polymerase sigma-70 factor (ECF subfamily)